MMLELILLFGVYILTSPKELTRQRDAVTAELDARRREKDSVATSLTELRKKVNEQSAREEEMRLKDERLQREMVSLKVEIDTIKSSGNDQLAKIKAQRDAAQV